MPAFPARTTLADDYPNPSNAVFKEGIGEFYDATKGVLGAAATPASARDGIGIGPVISFRNLLINGNFAINQRNYASGAATTGANQYTLDRWRIPTTGQNATFGAAGPDRTVTFPASGGEQVIEGASIVGGIYTLSWTGAATATVNGVAITNGGNTASLTPGANVTVKFVGAVGLAQFELGTVATPFERRHPGLELSLCQRYYETGTMQDGSYAVGGTTITKRIGFRVTKRVVPTLGTPTSISESNANGTTTSTATADSLAHVYAVTATGQGNSSATWTAIAEL